MSKHFVPSTAHTPADRLRKALDQAEMRMGNLRRAGPQALEILDLMDQIAQGLHELETTGLDVHAEHARFETPPTSNLQPPTSSADVRAEHARFETLQRQLQRQQKSFLRQTGAALREERAALKPDRARWWWYLDERAAEQRKLRVRRALTWGTVAAVVLVVAGLLYDRFIAPPPEVREAFQHKARGESLVEAGDLQAALVEFESATAFTPDDPESLLWQGVIHAELNAPDQAEIAFDAAFALYDTEYGFLLERAMAYLRAGDVAAASADVEQAIAQNPEEGRGYYMRASVAAGQGDYSTAAEDLEKAAELANAAGNTQLEATARTQLAMMLQLLISQQATPTE